MLNLLDSNFVDSSATKYQMRSILLLNSDFIMSAGIQTMREPVLSGECACSSFSFPIREFLSGVFSVIFISKIVPNHCLVPIHPLTIEQRTFCYQGRTVVTVLPWTWYQYTTLKPPFMHQIDFPRCVSINILSLILNLNWTCCIPDWLLSQQIVGWPKKVLFGFSHAMELENSNENFDQSYIFVVQWFVLFSCISLNFYHP